MGRLGQTLVPWVLPAVILMFWILASAGAWVHPYLLPSPGKVIEATGKMLKDGSLANHLGISFIRVLLGFAVVLILAGPLAFCVHRWVWPRLLVGPTLEFLRAIPPLAAIPLLILWFGIGEESKLAVIVLASFFPVYVNLKAGLDSVGRSYHELGKSLDFRNRDFLWHILLPAALPHFLAGVQLGLSYAWRALMGAEMVAAVSGLGYLILDSQEMGRIDRVLVGIFTLGLCGLVLDQGLVRLFRHIAPWQNQAEAWR